MSSCWKCEKPLPEGQVECEENCGRSGERSDMTALPKELKSSEAGVLALVRCLDAMEARKFTQQVILNGKNYLVTVELIEEENPS